jgi:hypothetical protein
MCRRTQDLDGAGRMVDREQHVVRDEPAGSPHFGRVSTAIRKRGIPVRSAGDRRVSFLKTLI